LVKAYVLLIGAELIRPIDRLYGMGVRPMVSWVTTGTVLLLLSLVLALAPCSPEPPPPSPCARARATYDTTGTEVDLGQMLAACR
jgi:hypothetical protein